MKTKRLGVDTLYEVGIDIPIISDDARHGLCGGALLSIYDDEIVIMPYIDTEEALDDCKKIYMELYNKEYKVKLKLKNYEYKDK